MMILIGINRCLKRDICIHIECCFPDVYVIQLDTPIWNVRTNRFYRKCGYRQTGKDIESVYYEKCKNGGYSL